MKSGTSSVGSREYHTCSTIVARLATYAKVASSSHRMNSICSSRVLAAVFTVATHSGKPFGMCFSHQPASSTPLG